MLGVAVTAVPFPPGFTVCGVVPVIVPPGPAVYVSVYVVINVAVTLTFAVTFMSWRVAVVMPSLHCTNA